MSDNTPFGFGRFVPGFDFLQNLAKNSAAGMPAMPSMPGMSSWVAPTVSEEELEKRIEELKAVQFWLDQNSRALTATVQALEVQKMTLATLKGMNVAMGDLASAFTPKPAAAADAPASRPAAAQAPAPASAPAQHAPHRAAEDVAGPDADAQADAAADAEQPAGVVDPMQWWTALGTQFQQIAANALKDVAQHQGAFDATRDMAAEAVKSATDMASHLAAQGLQGVQEATRRAASAAPAADVPKAATKRRAPAKAAGRKGAAAKAPAKKAPARTAAPSAARKPAPAPAPARAASGRSRTAR